VVAVRIAAVGVDRHSGAKFLPPPCTRCLRRNGAPAGVLVHVTGRTAPGKRASACRGVPGSQCQRRYVLWL
jgi:hypothetical protein